MLARPPLPPEQHETARAMQEQAQRMRVMVTNLLDMARLQNRDIRMQMAWQSVEELVGTALAAMRQALQHHVVSTGDLAAVPLVECDASLIERVLCNLLENAAKYTPAGSEIRIDAALVEEEVRITVSDRGPGLKPGTEKLVFEKFMRGERESAVPGVGLGLAVSQAIVSAHGGRIWAENLAGGGACFTVALKAGEPPQLPDDEATPSPPA
jgi:two-component system sensor histidine kinase KdpD